MTCQWTKCGFFWAFVRPRAQKQRKTPGAGAPGGHQGRDEGIGAVIEILRGAADFQEAVGKICFPRGEPMVATNPPV